MGVYFYPSGVETELKNIYIGEVSGWKPDPNRTLLYYKFDNNLLDSSGNGNNGTGIGGISYSLFSGSSTDYMLDSSNGAVATPITQGGAFNHAFTLSAWFKKNSTATLQRLFKYLSSYSLDIQYEFYNDFSGVQWYMEYQATPRLAFPMANPGQGVWKHIVFTGDGVNQIKCYIDGTEVQPYSSYNPTFNYDAPTDRAFTILCQENNTAMSTDEIILENVTWSSSEVSDYFNANKSKYGL